MQAKPNITLPPYLTEPVDKAVMEAFFNQPIESHHVDGFINWSTRVVLDGGVAHEWRPGMRIKNEIVCCVKHNLTGYDGSACAGINPKAMPEVMAKTPAVSELYPVSAPQRYPELLGPSKLSFDPEATCLTDDGSSEEGVAWRDIWHDLLARSIWLISSRFMLKDQYFRSNCLLAAKVNRKRPPRLTEDVTGPWSWNIGMGDHSDVKVQLYPYVVRCLIDEGIWPYITPPPLLVAPGPAPWVYKKRDNA